MKVTQCVVLVLHVLGEGDTVCCACFTGIT